jgi:allantoate deiminase
MSAPIESLSKEIQNMIAQTSAELEIESMNLPNRAGHDAMMAALAGVPTAMMFIPSFAGLSHTPNEQSRIKDIAAATRVQAKILEKMNQ